MELSHDETFFITGGHYKHKENVLKLSMGDVFGIKSELKPTVIHSAQYGTDEEGFNFIRCLAISPDGRRVFSGVSNERVLVQV